ncbi:MAG: N-acetylneuraminate synthase family protein [Deltaproteobacteria bacterium]|nr:N-acetylneuraminate synthase family protein [Deltaproteobacteria bacterium]
MIAALDCTKLVSAADAIIAIGEAAASHCDAVKLMSLPWSWCASVFNYADPRGIKLLTQVTDERSIERLDWFGTSAFEIFFDWADLDLVACAARTGKPLVLSVANSTDAELTEVVALARAEGAGGIGLVQRVLGSGLNYLDTLRRHNAVVGISDRSSAPGVVSSAIGRGARIVETRLTPRRITSELAAVVRDCDLAWAMLGNTSVRWTTN